MKGYFSLFAYLEPKYQCSGICNPSLFWYTLDLAENAVPTARCVLDIKQEVSGAFLPIGTACFVSGVIMSLIWLFQYAMWCKYDE